MRSVWTAWVLLSLFMAACGSPPPPAPPPAPEPKPAPVAKPEKPPEPEKPKEPEPEPTPPPVVEAKPKSKHTIGGTSISDVEGPAIVAEAQKVGWAPTNVAILGGTVGKYENIRFGIDNGKATGYIEIIRPAHEPTHGSANMMSPKDQKAMKESVGAVFFDEEAEVLIVVVVEDQPADAKKLLAKLVKN
jgi:hypothetical protein